MGSFMFSPCTLVVDGIPNRVAWGAWAPEPAPGLTDDERSLALVAVDGEALAEWRWTHNPVRRGDQWTFLTGDGRALELRAALPGDVVDTGQSRISLPEKVLRASFVEPGMDMELTAAVNPDDDYVLTVVMASGAGVFARYSQAWHEIQSATSLGSAYLIGVEEAAVEIYDRYDAEGRQVHLGQLPRIEGWEPHAISTVSLEPELAAEAAEAAEAEPVVSAGALVLPVEASDEKGIQGALAMGEQFPDVRFAIERRLAQLGWEGDVPW